MLQLIIVLEKSSQYFKVLARLLGHENVVKVFAVYGVEQRHAIIIMEYVGNRNLHHLLVERKEKHLSRDWLLEVAVQVENVKKVFRQNFPPSLGDESSCPLPRDEGVALGREASQCVGDQQGHLQAGGLWLLCVDGQKWDSCWQQGFLGGHPWISGARVAAWKVSRGCL